MAKPHEGMVDELPSGGLELLQKAIDTPLVSSERKTSAAKKLEKLGLLRNGSTTYWGRFIAKKAESSDRGNRPAVNKTKPNTAKTAAKRKPLRKTRANTAKKAAKTKAVKKVAKKKATKKTSKTVAKKAAKRKSKKISR